MCCCLFFFFFLLYCDPLDLHVLTHSFPTRRSAYLLSDRDSARSNSAVRRSALGTPYMPAWMSSSCAGVKNGSMFSSCGTMPMAAAAWRGSRSRSMSQILTSPELLITSWARILIRVDLPAPFGPSRANRLPRGIARRSEEHTSELQSQ